MVLLEWLILAAAAFGGLVALMYLAQRSLMYFPERQHTPPAMAGFPEAQEVALDTKDGERVIVWHLSPRGEKQPVVLYFHGNGGALRNRNQPSFGRASGRTAVSAVAERDESVPICNERTKAINTRHI